MSVSLSRQAYAGRYGPTTGDRIRLADTEILIEIEKDFAVYGEEVKFGGGKVIRDGQGQSPLPEKPSILRSTSSSPTPWSWITGESSKGTSASVKAASSASARRAIRSSSTASIRSSSSARGPRSSPAKT